eukprot:TRINITY_DN12376_c0_g1_i1.p1 TRINITY_DN12376_c0_g1~~TRINITY_DN12376_c0_g1_i1.p1  ORF type:complete len:146 (-),score=15.31 TRINITY_DN12376_c0_g1_i1:169-582(-)
MEACQSLLKLSGSSLVLSKNAVHALLLLLAKLTRDNDLSVRFLKSGLVDDVLVLLTKEDYFFEGGVQLLSIILRHLAEDSLTLQQAMEFEIKYAFSQANNSSLRDNATIPKLKVKSYLAAFCTPMLSSSRLLFCCDN